MKRLSNFFTLHVPTRGETTVVQRSLRHSPKFPSISVFKRETSSDSTRSQERGSVSPSSPSEGRQWIGSICVWCLDLCDRLTGARGRSTTGAFRTSHPVHSLNLLLWCRDAYVAAPGVV